MSLRSTVRAFILSESGYVSPRTGLPVAWVVGLLLAAAVVLAPDPAEAACNPITFRWDDCTSMGCAMYCSEGRGCCNSQCEEDRGEVYCQCIS